MTARDKIHTQIEYDEWKSDLILRIIMGTLILILWLILVSIVTKQYNQVSKGWSHVNVEITGIENTDKNTYYTYEYEVKQKKYMGKTIKLAKSSDIYIKYNPENIGESKDLNILKYTRDRIILYGLGLIILLVILIVL